MRLHALMHNVQFGTKSLNVFLDISLEGLQIQPVFHFDLGLVFSYLLILLPAYLSC